MIRQGGMTKAEDAALLFSPLSPAGEAVPAQWHFPVGLEDFPATADFHFWRREPGSPVGVLHPAGQPEEGLLLGEACALGCTGPLGLTAAEHALLGSCPAEGLAFFLCLGALPEEPGRAELRVCAVLAVALDGGRALRLSLPQELPERLPMTRLAAASRPEPREPAAGKRMGEPCRGHPSRAGGWAFTAWRCSPSPRCGQAGIAVAGHVMGSLVVTHGHLS